MSRSMTQKMEHWCIQWHNVSNISLQCHGQTYLGIDSKGVFNCGYKQITSMNLFQTVPALPKPTLKPKDSFCYATVTGVTATRMGTTPSTVVPIATIGDLKEESDEVMPSGDAVQIKVQLQNMSPRMVKLRKERRSDLQHVREAIMHTFQDRLTSCHHFQLSIQCRHL